MMPTSRVQRDHWVVKDHIGVFHQALVARFFDHEGLIDTIQVATGCCGAVQQFNNTDRCDWISALPPVALVGNYGCNPIYIVKWRAREIVTCLSCIAAARY